MICSVSKKEYLDYKVATADLHNWHAYMKWIADKVGSNFVNATKVNLLMGDNREKLTVAFGESDWRWRHEGQMMHVWVLHHEKHTFLAMSGRNKGTCLEVVVPAGVNLNESIKHVSGEEVVAFADWFLEELVGVSK